MIFINNSGENSLDILFLGLCHHLLLIVGEGAEELRVALFFDPLSLRDQSLRFHEGVIDLLAILVLKRLLIVPLFEGVIAGGSVLVLLALLLQVDHLGS